MIVIQLVFFISITIGTVISISGLGSLLNTENKDKFIINFFLGNLLLGLLLISIHFFFKINLTVILIILLLGIFFALRLYYFPIKKLVKKYFLHFVIFLLLIPIFISQKFHEDFGYYHLPHVINLVNEKIIFGLGNVNEGFVHNSIWLNILPIFYIGANYDFVTLPTFLLYALFIIYSIDQIIKHNGNSNSNYFLIICIFYLILKFTRISEFGNDIPALIYSILGIFYFIKYEEEDIIILKKNFFFLHISFVTFAILIKFSVIPIIVLTLYIVIKDFKNISKEIFKFNYITIYFLIILFFVQQFIYTGCFVFPSKMTCLNVSWFNNEFLNLQSKLELINKSYSVASDFISSEEYLVNFNWVPYWFERNYPEIIEHLLTMLIPMILFLSLSKKNTLTTSNIINIDYFKTIIFFLLVGFIFWFLMSPVYRFGILYFLCLVFILTVKLYKKKVFSIKIFSILLFLFLTFNFSKNINRIIQKNYIAFGIDKVNNKYIIYDNYNNDNAIPVFRPDFEANKLNGNGWQGRLCWDIPFICSYKEIKVDLINNYYFISR